MFLPGNPDHFCVFQLPYWTSWLSSRTRGCGARCSQPRPARPMGRSSVGPEQHCTVWWRSLQGISTRLRPMYIAGMIPQTLIGYSRWTNCRSNVHLLSLPERGLFYCCPSCCMRLPLTRRRGASSHNDPFYRSSNRERHSLFPTLMPNVMPPLGCSSQTTYHPVPQHQ
jgi:hypothetical protein